MPQQHADLLDQSGQTVESTGDQSPARTKLFKLTAMIKDPARIRQVRRKVSQILFFVIIRSFLHPSCLFLHRTFLCVRFSAFPSSIVSSAAFAKAHSPHSLSFSCHTSDTTRIPTGSVHFPHSLKYRYSVLPVHSASVSYVLPLPDQMP